MWRTANSTAASGCPKEDRYKTIGLATPDRESARDRAFDHEADVRFRLKQDVPLFNRPFRDVVDEYLLVQQRRADTGEISAARVKKSQERAAWRA